jgi:hypothetical protein
MDVLIALINWLIIVPIVVDLKELHPFKTVSLLIHLCRRPGPFIPTHLVLVDRTAWSYGPVVFVLSIYDPFRVLEIVRAHKHRLLHISLARLDILLRLIEVLLRHYFTACNIVFGDSLFSELLDQIALILFQKVQELWALNLILWLLSINRGFALFMIALQVIGRLIAIALEQKLSAIIIGLFLY